jgi:hypothetical protein
VFSYNTDYTNHIIKYENTGGGKKKLRSSNKQEQENKNYKTIKTKNLTIRVGA